MKRKRIILVFACVLSVGLLLCGCYMGPENGTSEDSSAERWKGSAGGASGFGSMPPFGGSSGFGSAGASSLPFYSLSDLKTDRSNVGLSDLAALPNKKIGWGAGYGKNGAQPIIPREQLDMFAKYGAFCMGSVGSKNVYMTFDLGYESGTTPSLLDILKEKDVKAVFFITRYYAKKNPELVDRMLKEGHVVGNHSCRHSSFPDIDLGAIRSEVMDMHDYIRQQFGYEMTLFRFPKGEYSERSLAAVQRLGYLSAFWSFAYLDYDESKQRGADYAYRKITDNLHDGAIILLHPESTDNIAAMPRVVDTIRQRGYKLTLLTGKPE